jgi:heptosyltransferase III
MAARVLIVFPGALGDLICLAPTIDAIAQRHRGAEVELMARMELAEFAVGRLRITRAHSIDRREVAMLFRDSPADSNEPARRDFGAFDRIYCWFSADDPRFRRALLDASLPDATTFHRFRPDAEGHIASAYLRDVAEDAKLEPAKIDLLANDLEEASHAIRGLAEAKKFVAVFPGSGSPAKNWPIEKFLALADDPHERALFILGPAEAIYEDALRAGGHLIIKNQPLGTVAAIASMATAFLGNDSGVSHLAGATGTPGIVLFGATDPARWRPLGSVTVLHREPIASIEVAEVCAALASISGVGGG